MKNIDELDLPFKLITLFVAIASTEVCLAFISNLLGRHQFTISNLIILFL